MQTGRSRSATVLVDCGSRKDLRRLHFFKNAPGSGHRCPDPEPALPCMPADSGRKNYSEPPGNRPGFSKKMLC